jgi:hypothetical protein
MTTKTKAGSARTTKKAKSAATNPIEVAPGAKLLGEVITWSCSEQTRYSLLAAALRDAGLDEGVARELAPRHAFTRACKKLAEDRIIRQVAEDDSTITFQFTKESKVGDEFQYALEAKLTLDKKSGKVTCDNAELAKVAQAELDDRITARTAGDVTTVIQRLFDRHANLFRIRDQGGCYFVPAAHAEFVGKVEALVTTLNGNLRRFPIPAGTPQGDRSVKESVAEGLAALIGEHRAAVEAFGPDTLDRTFDRAAERIRQTKFKVEAYAAYLAEEKERLEAELAESADHLRRKIEELTTAGPAFIADGESAWGKGTTEEEAVAEMKRHGRTGEREVAYKVWKVHPGTEINADGEFVHSKFVPAPELVREVAGDERSLV